MDPNANLNEQLDLAARMLDEDSDLDVGDASRLAELVLALDGWIRNGGFPPNAWAKKGS